jgi:hypothetical protein
MIAAEEFNTQYKERFEVKLTLSGEDVPENMKVSMSFFASGEEDEKEKVFTGDNDFEAVIETYFSLFDSNLKYNARINLKHSDTVYFKFKGTFQQLFDAKDHCVIHQFQYKDQQHTCKVELAIPKNSYTMYQLVFNIVNLPLINSVFGANDSFVRIMRKNPAFNTYSNVFQSEVVRGSSSPGFRPAKISLSRLCGCTFLILTHRR